MDECLADRAKPLMSALVATHTSLDFLFLSDERVGIGGGEKFFSSRTAQRNAAGVTYKSGIQLRVCGEAEGGRVLEIDKMSLQISKIFEYVPEWIGTQPRPYVPQLRRAGGPLPSPVKFMACLWNEECYMNA